MYLINDYWYLCILQNDQHIFGNLWFNFSIDCANACSGYGFGSTLKECVYKAKVCVACVCVCCVECVVHVKLLTQQCWGCSGNLGFLTFL